VVVAHPDDESFGLGAIISQMTATGAAVHILCYTHGEASTLNENSPTPARSHRQQLSGGGGSCKATASICAGCGHHKPQRDALRRRPVGLGWRDHGL
jgi:hypothetical protein